MQFLKFGSLRPVYVNINKYRIDWDGNSASKLQLYVKQFLKQFWFGQVVLEEFRVPGSKLRIDFLNLNKKYAIEVNGNQHTQFNKFFHGNRSNYFSSIQRDFKKLEWLEKNGFEVAEIEEEDVKSLSRELLKNKYNLVI